MTVANLAQTGQEGGGCDVETILGLHRFDNDGERLDYLCAVPIKGAGNGA